MQTSTVRQGCLVTFPPFTAERVYMHEFKKAAGLPADLVRWQPVVDAMLDGVDAPGSVFLMIDQAWVPESHCHRRSGVHVDGYWLPEIQAHGSAPGRHHVEPRPRSLEPETLILASDVFGCVSHVGEFDGEPDATGDCSHLDLCGLQRVDMEPGRAWMGHTMTMLHESIPQRRSGPRTVVRLNVKGVA